MPVCVCDSAQVVSPKSAEWASNPSNGQMVPFCEHVILCEWKEWGLPRALNERATGRWCLSECMWFYGSEMSGVCQERWMSAQHEWLAYDAFLCACDSVRVKWVGSPESAVWASNTSDGRMGPVCVCDSSLVVSPERVEWASNTSDGQMAPVCVCGCAQATLSELTARTKQAVYLRTKRAVYLRAKWA